MQISEPAEYAILGLLKSRPMHGYELFQQFAGEPLGQIVHLEMSQMYAFLKKLERLRYIEAQLEPQGVRPPRKVFHVTQVGLDVFAKWLIEPVEKPRDIRIFFLLKLYFVQLFLPRQMLTLVEHQILACQHFLDHLEAKQHLDASDGNSVFLDHVVLRSRIYQTRSLLEWMRELQNELVAIQ